MCKWARPSEGLGCAVLGGGVVTFGIRADPRGCAYGSVCMTPALDVPACAKGERPWTFDICPMWVSWTDEDVGFFEGGCVTSGPIWIWHSCGP